MRPFSVLAYVLLWSCGGSSEGEPPEQTDPPTTPELTSTTSTTSTTSVQTTPAPTYVQEVALAPNTEGAELVWWLTAQTEPLLTQTPV